jgi:hypothetical protein
MKTLLYTHPHLASEWDSEANAPLGPGDVTANSHKKVWWRCEKASDHKWQAIIQNRAKNGTTCPCCCNRKTVASNCLQTTHPDLCKEWCVDKNTITPTEVTAGSNIKVWWQCSKHSDHCWLLSIITRVRKKTGCPLCAGKQASSSNNLNMYPEIASEWDVEKNGKLPSKIPTGSRLSGWWICSSNPEHKWQNSVNNRVSKKHKCPYCAGKKADKNTSLKSLYPELMEEWDDPDIDPSTILPNSHKKVWWKCKKDSTHRWLTTPNQRISNFSVCPYCYESAGEKEITKYLLCNNVSFSKQYRFNDCRHKKPLPFDFAVHSGKLGLIEFQGAQHYYPLKIFGGVDTFKKVQYNDKIKKEYCLKNNIPLLEITDVRKIPEQLSKFLTALSS